LQRSASTRYRETPYVSLDFKIRWIRIIWAKHINLGTVTEKCATGDIVIVPGVSRYFVSGLLKIPRYACENFGVRTNVDKYINILCLFCSRKGSTDIATSGKNHHASNETPILTWHSS
jgi:hypothetical protein